MNSSSWTWIIGAIAVGLGLLLVVGLAPAETEVAEAPAEETVATTAAPTYWEPVNEPTVAVATPPTYRCPQVVHETRNPPVARTELAAPSAPRIQGTTTVERPALVGGCSPPRGPCQEVPCPLIVCSPCDPCMPSCWERPLINRNMGLCVDECALIQLHTTVPYPLSRCYSFRWTATKGTLLEPTASDPIYFAPATHLATGEDVWIAVMVIAPGDVRYTDQIRIRVRDTR
jgi:hypothetical protein